VSLIGKKNYRWRLVPTNFKEWFKIK